MPEGKLAMGLSNQTSFLRPITEGTIHAEATRRHRGGRPGCGRSRSATTTGRLCVLTRMTVAVRDAMPSWPGACI